MRGIKLVLACFMIDRGLVGGFVFGVWSISYNDMEIICFYSSLLKLCHVNNCLGKDKAVMDKTGNNNIGEGGHQGKQIWRRQIVKRDICVTDRFSFLMSQHSLNQKRRLPQACPGRLVVLFNCCISYWHSGHASFPV